LVTAKSKLFRLIEKSPKRLNTVIDYLNENHEKIYKYILNEDIHIVKVHCAIINEIIANIADINIDLDCIDDANKNSEDIKSSKADLIEKAKKLIDFVLFLFPKIPANKNSNRNHLSHLLYVIINL